MVATLRPAISAASSQVIFFAMAFKITSCSFIFPPFPTNSFLSSWQKAHPGIMLTLKCGSLATAFHFRVGALQTADDFRKDFVSQRDAPAYKQELSHGIARIQPDGGLGLSLGLGPTVELNQQKGRVRVMEGGGRIELQGALEFGDRLVEAPEPGVFDGQVAVRFGKIRVQSNRRSKFRFPARVVAGV